MKFTELESIMSAAGVNTLADIARKLETTPQAVSNWKARDQVPFHIVNKLRSIQESESKIKSQAHDLPYSNFSSIEESTISLSDIFLIIAEQLKIIVLTTFIFVFSSITYIQFIQKPEYVSLAKVLIPQSNNNLGGLSGLASQFGVNVPSANNTDLSNTSLFPDILRSRTFAEVILDKEFYSKKHKKKLTLLAILTHGDNKPSVDKEILINNAISTLNGMIEYKQDFTTSFSVIRVTSFEPIFSRDLAKVILEELEELNRFYKSKVVGEKTKFIDSRIASVEDDLRYSELTLKEFNEQNRQISSPALQLEQDRLSRDVDIQRGVFLTLKQQLELAKIEEVQETSIMQILDKPQIALGPSNKNLKLGILLGGFLGLGIGIVFGFLRSYTKTSDISERKKIRRIKNFINKKSKDFVLDKRVSGIISIILLFGMPFYLGHESKEPVYFNMYSSKLMLINAVYIFIFLFFLFSFIYVIRKNKNIE